MTFAIDGTPTGVRDATAPALPDSGGFRLLSPLPSTQLMLSNGGPMFSYATSNEVGRPVFVLEDVAGTRRLTCSDNQDSLGAFQLSALAVADYRASFPMEDPNRDYVARLGFTSSTSVMATVDGTQFPAEFEFFQGAEFTDVSI